MTTPQRQNFSKLYQNSIFITLSLVFLSLGVFWIAHEYSSHLAGFEKMRDDYIATRKHEVIQQVNIHIDDVRFKISRMESKLRSDLKLQTDNGWAIANNIYRNNKGAMPDDQIKKMIIEALMPIRFFENRGYYWILDTDHLLVAHPFRPDFIGKSEENLKDRAGQKFIRNFIKVAKENEEGGFVTYLWPKPGVGSQQHINKGQKKIAYLKLFKPYNWVIGTGEYVQDVEKQLQKQFLKRLNTIRYGDKGYIFTHNYEGVCLSHINQANIGLNRWQLQDANGMKVVQEIIKVGQKPGGGFVEYVASIDPTTGKPARKLSYVNALNEWQWVLGAGVYLDDINQKIAYFKQNLSTELQQRALATILIVVINILLSYFISHLLSKRLSNELNIFLNFFKLASVKPEKIDPDRLTISEFTNLAQAANRMIDERQKIQSDLQQAKEVWEKSFNAISDLVTIHDKDSHIIRANTAVCNFFGLKLEEIIGRKCCELFQNNSIRCPNCPGLKTLTDRHIHTATIPFPLAQKVFQVSTAPTFDENGQLEYIVHVAKDVSEQKRLEEELIQSRKMEAIGTLAGGIAHDFNNILTSMMGYADLAEEEALCNGNPAPYIKQVMTAGNRAGNLVKQILDFSRKSEQTLSPVSVKEVIDESIKLLRASIPATVEIKKEITHADGVILANQTKIHQIILNLCTNALHALPDQQGVLTIRLDQKELAAKDLHAWPAIKPGPFIELSVNDTGHGISPDIIDHIFDPYFTTKEVGKGIGMGLAVVHGIVKEHGGVIKVESIPLHGTTFYVYFPMINDAQMLQGNAETSPPPNGNEHILIIDDEKDITLLLKDGLERFGYKITAKTNSNEALADFTAGPDDFDLIITDQTMPDLSGLALAEKVLKIRPSMPIILYTGYSEIASEETSRKIGISKFLLKPIDSRTLAEHVRAIIDEHLEK